MADHGGDPKPAGLDPYAHSLDHLRDELARLDVLLRHRLEAWWAERDGDVDEFRGLYVSDEMVDASFPADATGRSRPAGDGIESESDRALRQTIEARTTVIAARRRRTVAAGTELRLDALAERFGLSAADVDVLLLALAPALDRRYETLYSYLHDDVTAKRPTVGLVCDVLAAPGRDPAATRRRFARSLPLLDHRLLRVDDGGDGPSLSRPVTVDERVVDYLLGGDDPDPALDGVVAVMAVDTDTGGVDANARGGGIRTRTVDVAARANGSDTRAVDPTDLAEALGLAGSSRGALARLLSVGSGLTRASGATRRSTDDERRPPMGYVWGPQGSGRRAVATALARTHGGPLLVADASGVAESPLGFAGTLDRIRREGVLQGATLSVDGVGRLGVGERARLVSGLDDFPGPVVLSGDGEWRPRTPPRDHVFVGVPLSVPSTEARRRLWRSALGDADVADADVAARASKSRLTPGAIRDAVATARQTVDGEETTVGALYEACRLQAGGSLADLAQPVAQPHTWDDIVLPADRLAQLRTVAARVAHRGTVYDDWGFADRYATGNGLVALFSGPSGTGKTMAASIIAREAGLDLYRIDLSSVVSKYIGETEKNLSRIFDEAGKGDAVLLFDEADALFGKRSEVRDAHDRYANVEVNYLLQRVETYDGVVILTTNFKRNIDEAFTRRIHLCVEFPRPVRDAREAIWRQVFPARTPVEELDFEFLSTLELTGGSIKNAALTAAFAAADEGERVRMEHVVGAVKREFQKAGTLVDPDEFGAYRDSVTDRR